MANSNRLYATLQLIRCTLLPAAGAPPLTGPASGPLTVIPPENFAATLASLDSLLQDGRLKLLFAGALAPAAPCLLFFLKRNGYSDCRAIVTAAGIELTARR